MKNFVINTKAASNFINLKDYDSREIFNFGIIYMQAEELLKKNAAKEHFVETLSNLMDSLQAPESIGQAAVELAVEVSAAICNEEIQ